MPTHSTFHLSLGTRAIDASVDFFTRVLRGNVVHRDPSGYVNVDLHGCQLTLTPSDAPANELAHFHFGFNFDLADFEELAAHVAATAPERIVSPPKIVDAGTPLERKKIYLRCPDGYLIELKGFRA